MQQFGLFLSFYCFSLCFLARAQKLEASLSNGEDQIIYDKYKEIDQTMKRLVEGGVKSVFPYIMQANEKMNLSSSCRNDLFQLLSGVRKLKLSAIKFLDAMGKPPSGLLTGTIHMLGDYDECLSISIPRKNNVPMKGQYCLVNAKTILPKKKKVITAYTGLEELIEYSKNHTSELMQYFITIMNFLYAGAAKVALCIPSGCSTEDITVMLALVGEIAHINATVEYCDHPDESHIYTGTIVAIAVFSLIGLLVLIGSIADFYYKKKKCSSKSTCSRYLICFSLLQNFPKVISTKTSDKSLSSIFGIRSLSLFWIILLHQVYCLGDANIEGHVITQNVEKIGNLFYQVRSNGFLATEIFFFIGGLVNTYSRMNAYEKGNRGLNFIQIIIHRLWRIYPPYIVCLLLSFLFTVVNGPMGNFMREHRLLNCRKYWWLNMLFVNNIFNTDVDSCIPQAWYVAADMQLFLLSLFTLPILFRSPKRGIILHLGIVLAGLVSSTLWALHKNIPPGLIFYRVDMDEYRRLTNAYWTTFPHIAPYFTGVLTGYILSKWKELKIPMTYQVTGWTVASITFTSMLFMTKRWNAGAEFTLLESSLYFSFSRFLFALAVAWMVVCCARGYGGIINYILSLDVWIPIARISFMVYLISPYLQFFYFGHSKLMLDWDRLTMIWRYMGDLVICCLMGLALVVLTESPFISMEKLIFGGSSTKEKENQESKETDNANNKCDGNFLKDLKFRKDVNVTVINLQEKI